MQKTVAATKKKMTALIQTREKQILRFPGFFGVNTQEEMDRQSDKMFPL